MSTTTSTPGDTSPSSPPPISEHAGLGAEVRESLLLLAFAVGVTVGITAAAQAALAVLS